MIIFRNSQLDKVSSIPDNIFKTMKKAMNKGSSKSFRELFKLKMSKSSRAVVTAAKKKTKSASLDDGKDGKGEEVDWGNTPYGKMDVVGLVVGKEAENKVLDDKKSSVEVLPSSEEKKDDENTLLHHQVLVGGSNNGSGGNGGALGYDQFLKFGEALEKEDGIWLAAEVNNISEKKINGKEGDAVDKNGNEDTSTKLFDIPNFLKTIEELVMKATTATTKSTNAVAEGGKEDGDVPKEKKNENVVTSTTESRHDDVARVASIGIKDESESMNSTSWKYMLDSLTNYDYAGNDQETALSSSMGSSDGVRTEATSSSTAFTSSSVGEEDEVSMEPSIEAVEQDGSIDLSFWGLKMNDVLVDDDGEIDWSGTMYKLSVVIDGAIVQTWALGTAAYVQLYSGFQYINEKLATAEQEEQKEEKDREDYSKDDIWSSSTEEVKRNNNKQDDGLFISAARYLNEEEDEEEDDSLFESAARYLNEEGNKEDEKEEDDYTIDDTTTRYAEGSFSVDDTTTRYTEGIYNVDNMIDNDDATFATEEEQGSYATKPWMEHINVLSYDKTTTAATGEEEDDDDGRNDDPASSIGYSREADREVVLPSTTSTTTGSMLYLI